MYIGFPIRNVVVRENMNPTASLFSLPINITSLLRSEIEYRVTVSVAAHTATVTANPVGLWDAIFGLRDPNSNILISDRRLVINTTEILNIPAIIRNDIIAEDNETFTLRVSATDTGGTRRNFKCYNDGEEPVKGDIFCSLTVTIIDEDGKFHFCCMNELVLRSKRTSR